MKKALFLAWSVLFTALPVMASESFHYTKEKEVHAIGRIYATIVMPVSMKSVKDMSFGMLVNNKSGNVKMDGFGNRSSTGPGLATGAPAAGRVLLKGPNGHLVTVSIPESNIYDNENQALDFKPVISDKHRTFALNNHNGEALLNIGGKLTFHNNNISNGTKKGFYVVQTSY